MESDERRGGVKEVTALTERLHTLYKREVQSRKIVPTPGPVLEEAEEEEIAGLASRKA